MITRPLATSPAPAVSAVSRVPLYFGPPDRAVFGWYHAPAAGAGRNATAIVICPPLGYEYINSHRSLRHLADCLAAAGMPALRFDYLGTGDSAGREGEPDRLAAWIANIHEAVAALRAESGCERVGVAGFRMGATLAAIAACEIDVSCLVLWAPCARGRTFLRELKALDLTTHTPAEVSRTPTEFETGGFQASESLQGEIARVNLEQLTPRARRVLIVARHDLPDRSGLLQKWSAAGLAVDHESLAGYTEMVAAPHHTRIPDTAIDHIVRWIAAAGPRQRPISPRRPGTRHKGLALGDVRESVIWFGERRRLFGIVSEPVGAIDPAAPAVVISNAGSVHHVGPNRLYVSLARTLSQAGFRCLRIDLPGLGDSVIDDPALENIPYIPNASAVIALALDALSQHSGATSFILAGLCSGAHTAFHAALDLDARPIVESILINPLTYAYTPGMSLDALSTPHVTRWQRYRRSIGSVRGWSKLFRTEIDSMTIARDVLERSRIVGRHWLETLGLRRDGSPDATASTDLARNLTCLAERGRHLTLVFSRFDPGYDLLMIGAGQAVKALRKRGRITIAFIESANHTFDAKAPRAAMIAAVTTALAHRYLDR